MASGFKGFDEQDEGVGVDRILQPFSHHSSHLNADRDFRIFGTQQHINPVQP